MSLKRLNDTRSVDGRKYYYQKSKEYEITHLTPQSPWDYCEISGDIRVEIRKQWGEAILFLIKNHIDFLL